MQGDWRNDIRFFQATFSGADHPACERLRGVRSIAMLESKDDVSACRIIDEGCAGRCEGMRSFFAFGAHGVVDERDIERLAASLA